MFYLNNCFTNFNIYYIQEIGDGVTNILNNASVYCACDDSDSDSTRKEEVEEDNDFVPVKKKQSTKRNNIAEKKRRE